MTPRPRNATFAIAGSLSSGGERLGAANGSTGGGKERQTPLFPPIQARIPSIPRPSAFGVEGKVPRADAVVGAVGDHAVERAVEQRLELGVALAQPDADAGRVEGRIEGRVGDEPAAAQAFRAVEEPRHGELVAEHEVEALGAEVEVRVLELAVALHLRLGIALLEEASVLAVGDRADGLAG